MPLPVILGAARCSITGTTANGQPWANVLHLATIPTAAWSGTNSADAAEALHDLYWATGFGAGEEGWAFYAADPANVLEIDVTPLDGTSPTYSVPETLTATPDQDSLPGEVALIISHLTAVRGRSGRGRTYWASPYEGLSNAIGEVTGPVRSSIRDAWIAFDTALFSNNLRLVVASYIGAGSVEPVVDHVVRPYFGHQDRRRR